MAYTEIRDLSGTVGDLVGGVVIRQAGAPCLGRKQPRSGKHDHRSAHKNPDTLACCWANLKNGLGNLAADSVDQLVAIVKNGLKRIQYRPELINGFLAQTGLSLEAEHHHQTLTIQAL